MPPTPAILLLCRFLPCGSRHVALFLAERDYSPCLFANTQLSAGSAGDHIEVTTVEGAIAPFVLKFAEKAALSGELEREWLAGRKLTSLSDETPGLTGFMRLRRPPLLSVMRFRP